MNSDNFLIEEYDLEQAKNICQTIETPQTRQRAVANALAGSLALRYFSAEYEVESESGLFNVSQVLAEYDIADIYIKNNYIDVRLYLNENELCVPKSHYDNDMQPVAYMFIKIEDDISGALVTGFVPSDAVNTDAEYDGYYRVNESELVSFFDIEPLLSEVYESAVPDDINKLIFEFLEGNLENKQEFYKLLLTSREARFRLIKAAKAEVLFNFISTVSLEETVDDVEMAENLDFSNTDSEQLMFSDNESLLEEEPLLVSEDNFELSEDLSLDANLIDEADIDVSTENNDTTFDEVGLVDDSQDLLENIDEDDVLSDETDNVLTIAEEFDFSTEITPSLQSFDYSDDVENLVLEDETLVEEYDTNEIIADVVEVEEVSGELLDEDIALQNDFIDEVVLIDESEETNSEVTEDLLEFEDEIQITEEIVVENTIEDYQPDVNAVVEDNVSLLFNDESDEIITEEIADYSPEENIQSVDVLMDDSSDDEIVNEEYYEQDNSDNVVDENSLETLFNNESQDVEEDSSIVNEQNYVQPKKRSLIPTIGLVAVLIGAGYFAYNKFIVTSSSYVPDSSNAITAPAIPADIEGEQVDVPEAMPNETIENDKANTVSNEGLPVSIPAIEKNLDASILVSNLKINWEVPVSYISNSSAKRYLTKLGKIIQVNLKSELLLLNKVPITNKIVLVLEFDKKTSHFKVKSIGSSSGDNSIDAVIKQTVEKALSYNLSSSTSAFTTLEGNPSLVIRL